MIDIKLFGRWGHRRQTISEIVDLIQQTTARLSDRPGDWVTLHKQQGSRRRAPRPIDVTDAAAIEAAVLEETSKSWAVPGTPNYLCSLYLTTGKHHYPLAFDLTADDDDGSNRVSLELTVPGEDDPATRTDIDTALRVLVDQWDPDWLSTRNYDFLRTLDEHGQQTYDVEVGWMTYISDRVPLDTELLTDSVTVETLPTGGHIITLTGTPKNPNLEQALLLRRALGYQNTEPSRDLPAE